MSDELENLETELLGQLSKMQDYQSSLETQNSELIAQNEVLKTQHQELLGQLSAAKAYQSSLETQNQTLSRQLKDVKTYQSEVMIRNKELTEQHNELITQNGGLLKTQKEFKLANQSLTESIAALEAEQDQPQPLSMTTIDEPFLSEKDELIQNLESRIDKLTEKVTQMRKTIMILERR